MMQYTLATLLALAGAALAQTEGFDAIVSPPQDTTMQAGEAFVIQWEPAPSDFDDEKIDIVLLAGKSPSTLSVVEPAIAEGLTNSVGSFEWLVPEDLGEAETYGIKIMLQSDPDTFQFSFPFAIDPVEGGASSGNSSSTPVPTPTGAEGEDEEETSSSYAPSTTLYTTPAPSTDDVTPDATLPATTPGSSPAAGAQATAGAFAIIGGLAVAALAL